MHDFHSAATVVVGVDGSPAALSAAVWATDEAISRDIPLKLVSVVHNAAVLGTDTCGAGPSGGDQLAIARAALAEARHTVDFAAARAKVETEVLWGNPLATLIELSRSAAMLCVGAIGIAHTCHRAGSTAAALAGSAGCPVAVIRQHDDEQLDRRADTGHIVAEVDARANSWPDNNAVLRWAMAEAELRSAPLRIIASVQPQSGAADDSPDELDRRIEHWARQHPRMSVESVAVPGSITEYLAGHAESIQLFVSATRDRRSLGWPGSTGGCSVLTVGGPGR